MSEQTSVRKAESAKHNLRIKVLLEKLRNKLKTFTVQDADGLVLGTVKDVNINSDRQLNLVVSKATTDNSSGLVLIRSNHIQQVNYSNKSLSIDLNKAQTDELPEFKLPEHLNAALATPPSRPAAVSQVVDENAVEVNNESDTDNMQTVGESTDNVEEFEDDLLESDESSQVVTEEVIRLLEERLVVDMTRRKVGEVIVRKEIETRMVEVPVHYEKLIVEQVSPEYKQLAEIELGHEEIPGIELGEIATAQKPKVAATGETQVIVSGEFTSVKAAGLLLDAIALQKRHGCKKVRVEIVLEDEEHRETYQQWFDRCSGKQ